MNILPDVSLLAILLSTSLVIAEKIRVQPRRTFCFYRNFERNAKSGVQYQAEQDRPVHLKIIDPYENVVHDAAANSYGSYTFDVKNNGRFKTCFVNESDEVLPMSFNELGDGASLAFGSGSSANLDPAQEQIRLLNNGLRGIRDEQELLMMRETQHRQMAESTRRRVSWWFVMQTLLLGTVVFFQIWYMKRFFETRRVM